jgi:hypothetical protein
MQHVSVMQGEAKVELSYFFSAVNGLGAAATNAK